jgi:hypothetical protein
MIAFRVDEKLERRIKQMAASADVPVSAFLRKVVEQALDSSPEVSPYEAAHQLIGKYDSGRSDLSGRHSQILREKLRAKHNR